VNRNFGEKKYWLTWTTTLNKKVVDSVAMGGFVKKMTDKQVIELSARIAEWEFQVLAKQPTDFKTIESMISTITYLYK